MRRVALIYSPLFARHQTGQISMRGDDLLHHISGQELVDPVYTVAKLQYPFPLPGRVPNPEQPNRTIACYEALAAFGLIGDDGPNQLWQVAPRPASFADLARVHTPEYIRRVKALSRAGGGELAESTYIGKGSYKWAALSAGAGLTAAQLIFEEQANSALVVTRPPGHHAAREGGAGFCVFNNVAVIAENCRQQWGCRRVLIVDWDLHHGDGTQAIFYEDPNVLVCSLHQFGPELYPEKGDFDETGAGPGTGYTVNLPLPAKTSEADYLALFERVVPALTEKFQPDIILVSAGYDGHFNDTQNPYVWDPGGGLSLTAQTYAALTRIIADCAARFCHGRYIVLLEGGYNLYCLPAGMVNTAAAMLGHPPLISETIPPTMAVPTLDTGAYLQRLRECHPHFGF